MFVHLQSRLKHNTGSLLEGCIECCFVRNAILLLEDPNELEYHNKNDTNGWVNLSVINVSVESFLLYPDEPLMYVVHGKNYQADTDALNKNVVQYRGDAGLRQHSL